MPGGPGSAATRPQSTHVRSIVKAPGRAAAMMRPEMIARWVPRRLLSYYGRPVWEARYAPLDELIGTILSQHTSDINSERAFASLSATFATWEAVRDAPLPDVIAAIRSGGLAVVKASRIQNVLHALTSAD